MVSAFGDYDTYLTFAGATFSPGASPRSPPPPPGTDAPEPASLALLGAGLAALTGVDPDQEEGLSLTRERRRDPSRGRRSSPASGGARDKKLGCPLRARSEGNMPEPRIPISGSERKRPDHRAIGAPNPSDTVTISIYLKRPPGRDACTGLVTPKGQAIASLFAAVA